VRRLAILLLLLAGPALAQEDVVGRPFWVSTPPGAAGALKAATGATATGDWTGAARALQTIFDRYPEAFVQSGARYLGARRQACQILATAPTELRAEYERLYGPPAEEALRQALAADDREGLLAVVRTFEATGAGLQALLLLADSAMLRGRPAEARLVLDRITRLHAAAAAGDAVRTRRAHAAARDYALGGAPPDATEQGQETAALVEPDAWPMMGGNARRDRVAENVSLQPVQWSAETEIKTRNYDEPPQPETTYAFRGGRADPRWEEKWIDYAPVHPVIARSVLVVNEGRRLVAYNLYTGEVAWRYPEMPEVERDGRTNLSDVFSAVVADGVVYAAVEVPVAYRPQTLQNVPIIYYLPERRLVALDLETGELIWRHDDEWFAQHPESAQLRDLSISGSPVVRGDRLYAGACSSEGTFHNFLLALDRQSGRLLYSTRISNGQQELNLFGRQLQECVATPVTEADGVLYYGTNLGVVAAVDALLGSPLWATPYPILDIPSTYYWFEAPRRWPLLDNGPPLVSGDLLLVTPADSSRLLAIDRRNGTVAWTLPYRLVMAPQHSYDLRTMQAVDRERLYVSGRSGVLALWLIRDPARGAAPGEIAWECPFLEDDLGAGRGLLAENGLLVPGSRNLYRIDAVSGKMLQIFRREREGESAEDPVNLVWGDGALVCAGRDVIWARFDRDNLPTLARDRMRRHPDDIGPVLGAADIYLATGSWSQAVDQYRRAKAWAETRGAHAAGERAQRGLHRALMRRAEESLSNPTRAADEFETAIRAAPDERTRLRARLHLDNLLQGERTPEALKWRLRNLKEIEKEHGDAVDETTGRPIRGWAMLEMAEIHIESDDLRRALAVRHALLEADPDSEEGRRASQRIRSLLEERGRAIYEPYERQAGRLFESALRAGDLEGLARGLRIYANAEAAVGASLELARRQLRAGDETAAVRVLQAFLVERPGSDRVAEALTVMVEALTRRKSYGPAYAALLRLKTRYPDVMVPRADGARVSAGVFAEEWLEREPFKSLARSTRRLDLDPDLQLRFKESLSEVVDIPDLLGQRPEGLPEVVVLRTSSQALVLDARTGSTVYRLDFGQEDPVGPLVFTGNRLFCAATRSIRVFDATTGRALFRQPMPENGRPEYLIEHRGQVFLLFRRHSPRGRVGLAALHPEDGSVLWSQLMPPGADDSAAQFIAMAQGDRLLLLRTYPVELSVIDPTTGAIENRIEMDRSLGTRLAVAPIALPDGRLLVGIVTRLPMLRFEYRHSYTVFLVDPASPPDSAILWRFKPRDDGENHYLYHLNAAGDYVAALDEVRGTAVLDLATGALRKWEDKLPVPGSGDDLTYLDSVQPRNDSLLLALTRSVSDAPARLNAYELPDLRPKYSIELTDSGQEMPRLIEAQGVLGFYIGPRGGRPGLHKIRLFDPLTARLLNEITLPARNVNWVSAKVQNGVLLVTTSSNQVYAYGPR